MLVVTALYTAILVLIMVFLAYKTSSRRMEAKISLGTGNDDVMECRSRAFGNFVEFVPMMIILMAIIEIQGQQAVYVHILGITTVIARIFHAMGITGFLKAVNGRFIGSLLTYLMLMVGGFFLLYISIIQLM